MKTVERTMYYPTFNEKKNDFDYKEVTHRRPRTKEEQRANLAIDLFWWISLCLICACLPPFIIGVAGNFMVLGLSSLGTFLGLILITIALEHWWIDKNYYPIIEHLSSQGFDKEIAEWERITEEQNAIAEKWRAEHEFEELIRQAKLSANCNDIAQVAKYYAEHYIKGAE